MIVGEQRIDYITKIDWKAHHRETNNLIGIFWDFIKDIPTIVFAFYSNTLTKDHWGKIVTPKESGGRTTSVSIMNAKGIKNMYNGCIAVLNLPKYTNFIKKKKEK